MEMKSHAWEVGDCDASLEILLPQSPAVNNCNLYLTLSCGLFLVVSFFFPPVFVIQPRASFICLLSLMAEFHLTGAQCFRVHMALRSKTVYLLAFEWFGQNLNFEIVWGWLMALANCSCRACGHTCLLYFPICTGWF